MHSTFKLAMGSVVGALMLGAMPALAAGQSEDISQKQIPSLELQQADVREALRALFKNVDVSYSIAPDVQGTVTVSLKNVTFETALQNVLRQVDATYRVEAGVYEVVHRTEVALPIGTGADTTARVTTTIVRRIKIRSADPAFIAMMLGGKAGNQNYDIAPERSTIQKTNASGGMMGGMGGGMMGGGMMGGGMMGGGGMGGFGGGMMGGGMMGGGMMGGGMMGGGMMGGGMGGFGGGYGGGGGRGGFG